MPVALVPRTMPQAKSEEAFRECWHNCPECHEDHMHEIGFQGAKLDAYFKVCHSCRLKRSKNKG